MKQELKILKIGDIKIDENLYPRFKWNWMTAETYAVSMKNGDVFPPITVALYNGKYYLVDGRHRLEASKRTQLNVKKVEDRLIQCEILKGLTAKQIYAESIKRNITNGLPFTQFDKLRIIQKLEKLKFSIDEISKIVKIPNDMISKLKFTSMTKTVGGQMIALKGSTKHLYNQTVNDNFEDVQADLGGSNQRILLKTLISLIENGLLNLDDNEISNDFNRLTELILGVNAK